jgi:ferredoxin
LASLIGYKKRWDSDFYFRDYGPLEFLWLVRHAKFVLTGSFYALIFSLILNTPFLIQIPGILIEYGTCLIKLEYQIDRIIHREEDIIKLTSTSLPSGSFVILRNRSKSQNSYLTGVRNCIKAMIKMTSIKSQNCTGCRACQYVCPSSCIDMVYDDEGFIVPRIDENKCVFCGACDKVCPETEFENICTHAKGYYGAINKNNNQLERSSSGGVFPALAEYFLDLGGAVVGCALSNNYARQVIVENIDDLPILQGSKYVQSDTADSYPKVKSLLDNGRIVFYTGTACQIAGLKAFLKSDYKRLFTADIVCHGVPSPKLLNECMNYLYNKHKFSAFELKFRSKSKSKWGNNFGLEFASTEKNFYIPAAKNAYYRLFLSGATYRECCYSCRYTSPNRISDFTLGDYWGVEKFHPKIDTDKGVSLLMVNTRKAEEVMSDLSNRIFLFETELDWVASENQNLIRPSERPAFRDEVYVLLNRYGYKYIEKQIMSKYLIKNLIPLNVKRRFKAMLRGLSDNVD